jgi:DNA-binding CsgD family transcriptional regulator
MLVLMAQGISNRAIVGQLDLSQHTVLGCVKSILAGLGVQWVVGSLRAWRSNPCIDSWA